MLSTRNDPTRSARRPTVVLLHSSGSSARQWDRLAEMLRPAFLVRAVDFHGHGGQRAWTGRTALTLADDAALVAPLLGDAGGAHIVGHSYGAAVAMKVAALNPRHVRSLVAYEPVVFRWLFADPESRRPAEEIVRAAVEIRARLARGDAHASAERFVDFWSGGGTWRSLPADKRSALAARMLAVVPHFDALFNEPPSAQSLARLDIPMLFLSGAHTVSVTQAIAELLRTTLPQARHAVLPGMNHMGPITHAPEVNARIAAFLDAQTCAAPVVEPESEMA